jgi:hypothetical protein
MMLSLFLRFISASLVVALPFDDTRWRHQHHGRSLYRKKRRAFADEENLFLDGSHHAVITNNNKRNVQVVHMSQTVVASSSKAPESGGKSIECDPRTDDAKPDVGILACAKGFQCVQSNESALGGVCRVSAQQQRLLDQSFGGYAEYFCGDNSGQQGVQSPYESCDCSQLVNGVGPFNCTVYSRYCFDVDEKYCASVTSEGEIKADGTIANTQSCYDFTSPYTRSICYSDVFVPDPNSTDCGISIDGVTCNSCTTCNTSSVGETGIVWDCSNTVAASLGRGTGNQCTGNGYPLPLFDTIADLPPLPTPAPSGSSMPAGLPTFVASPPTTTVSPLPTVSGIFGSSSPSGESNVNNLFPSQVPSSETSIQQTDFESNFPTLNSETPSSLSSESPTLFAMTRPQIPTSCAGLSLNLLDAFFLQCVVIVVVVAATVLQ